MPEWRQVDPECDRHLLLDLHCQVNYESETRIAREASFESYREKWLSTSQTERFLSNLTESMEDERTIAEILEDAGEFVAYAWVTFRDVQDYDITIAEIMDIIVSPAFRGSGIGTEIMQRVEQLARERGAEILRSDTGIENAASRRLHEKMGFETYKIHYEKLLKDVGPLG